jgi:hypothetical protein
VQERPKIIELRQFLAEKFPHQERRATRAFATGVESLDTLLSGGLPIGSISEVTASQGAGLLLAALLKRVSQTGMFLALVDGSDSFDPASVDASALRRMLLVSCRSAEKAVHAVDLLLRDGNLPLVVLDLSLNPLSQLRKIPSTTWYRLQRVVEPTSTAFLVLTSQSIVSSAQVKLEMTGGFSLDDLDQRQSQLMKKLAVETMHVTRERFRPPA